MDQDTTGSAPAEEPRSLEDILDRAEVAPQQAEPAGQPEPQAEAQPPESEGPPRDDAGRFAPKGEKDAAPPAAKDEPKHVPVGALRDERQKRQALEREIADLRAKLTAPPAPPAQHAPQQPAQPPAPLADVLFQDPERFVQTFEERQNEALLQTRIAMSEAAARHQFPDYDEAQRALEAYAVSSEQARAEVRALLRGDPAPAFKAYQAGKHILAHQQWSPLQQQYASPEAYAKAMHEQWTREAAQQPQQPDQSRPRLPTSLASARAAAPRTGPGWSGPPPLDAILGRRG